MSFKRVGKKSICSRVEEFLKKQVITDNAMQNASDFSSKLFSRRNLYPIPLTRAGNFIRLYEKVKQNSF